MVRPDDSSLDPYQLRAVEERARKLLDRASAWGRYPTPIDDILNAAKVRVAPVGVFDPAAIMAYIRGKAVGAVSLVKSAISKIFGIYDGHESLIHIDGAVAKVKQTFLKLHETGHHEIPTHRKMFRFFQDCEKTLAPEVAELFEREANNFARFALFQGDHFARVAADLPFEIKTPMKLSKKFGASVYASAREFARSNARACVVYVLERAEFCEGDGFRAMVRRIEPSRSFTAQFGYPTDTVITPDHFLADVLPIGRKMTRPVSLSMTDLDGTAHECVAEAFDTTRNIIILLYPVRALTASTVVLRSCPLTL